MNDAQKRKTRLVLFMALAAMIVIGWPSTGRAKFRAALNLDASNVGHRKVKIAKGETLNQDVVTSGPISIEGTLNGDCISLGGPADIRGEVLGDVSSLGGPIAIAGTVRGDVSSMGGSIKVSGVVKGDIRSLGGDVTLADHASVLGDVSLMGGRLNKSDSAVLRGDVTHLNFGMMRRFAPLLARYGKKGDLGKAFFFYHIIRYAAFLAFAFGIGLMVILLSAFLPRQVETVAGAIKRDFWKSFGIGALILMLISPGLLLMLVSVLGIPLVPLAILLICVAMIMSLAAFSLILAERFRDSLKKSSPSVLGGVCLGYLLLTGLLIIGKLLELAGRVGGLLGGIFILANAMILCFAIVVGLGAIWTTRMGSRGEGARSTPPAPEPSDSQNLAR